MWKKSPSHRGPSSLTIAALIAALIATSAAFATTHSPAAPPDVIEALGEIRNVGSGRLRWFGLHVYDARLWLPGPPAVAPKAPKALELTYARRFSGPDIATRSIGEITRLGRGSDEQRVSWERAMRRLFPDVVAGDRLLGIHRRGDSVAFLHNGRAIGEIDLPGFADAFFAIWLDPKTTAPELRAQLLGLTGSGDAATDSRSP